MSIKNFLHLLFLLLPSALTAQTRPQVPFANTIPILATDSHEQIILKATHVVPTSQQVSALDDSFIGFVHFGPNTFTRKEWGNGMEDPKIFALYQLDTDQWCRAMKAAGMTKVILTVKHHDGFVLWQSRYTKHGIMSTPYKGGKGDILRELTESCHKYGIKLGIYLSPADLFQIESPDGLYGNLSKYSMRTIPRPVEGRPFANKKTFQFKVDDYNEYFLNQLFELLTEYGPVHEVWFDGAHPKRKGGQTYNYQAWRELIRTLAPEAVIFGKEDIRWAGNEAGATRATEWNVIPYDANPDTMNVFGDLTGDSIGVRSQLYGAKYLHYQPAETNTSIREGWFYRDDETQKTRTADDVFDIYERAVGGNSIFLLNIPPNREGRFPDKDVQVLEEVGRRINDTYGKNLFANAAIEAKLLDNDLGTYLLLNDNQPIVIKLAQPQTINRLMLQEAVPTHGERVEEHAVDAWINGRWQEVARSTNIGYRRILRFPDVTSNQFRIRVLQSRNVPAIATVSAYYYTSRPPQLEITRDMEGKISIQPKKDRFGWNRHGVNATENLNRDLKITYSVDDGKWQVYDKPVTLAHGTVKAVAHSGGRQGSEVSQKFGYVKKDWKVLEADSHTADAQPQKAFDANEQTFWQSASGSGTHFLAIDLGQEREIAAFSYTPPQQSREGMIEQGVIWVSNNGRDWKKVESFEFGNLINDPSTRMHTFKTPVKARWVKVEAGRIAGNGKSASIAELEFFAR